jgi:putative ABC transport system permease protein
MKLVGLMVKNLTRNPVRSLLTAGGTIILVAIVTIIWTVLGQLARATAEKSANFKTIITERWQLPSQMPYSYARTLEEGAAREPGDIRPEDSMTWQFFIGSTEPGSAFSLDTFFFAFCLEPKKILSMFGELDEVTGAPRAQIEAGIKAMEANTTGIVMGKSAAAKLNKIVGSRLKIYSRNYKDIEMEFEVVGILPDIPSVNGLSFVNRDYLVRSLEQYERDKGKKHPLADKTLNLVWLKVPDMQAMEKLSGQIMGNPSLSQPEVKMETASSGIASFIESYRDLLWAMQWVMVPTILVSLSLVMANSISISIRERRGEIAVMKVLGFRPMSVLILVVGEALILGTLAGLLGAGLLYGGINASGGLFFPIAFITTYLIPTEALWWGPAIGAGTALAGALLPALSACQVRVAEVFARVA